MKQFVLAFFLWVAAFGFSQSAHAACDSPYSTQQTVVGTFIFEERAFYRTGSAYGLLDENNIFWKVYVLGPFIDKGIKENTDHFIGKKVRMTACFPISWSYSGAVDSIQNIELV